MGGDLPNPKQAAEYLSSVVGISSDPKSRLTVMKATLIKLHCVTLMAVYLERVIAAFDNLKNDMEMESKFDVNALDDYRRFVRQLTEESKSKIDLFLRDAVFFADLRIVIEELRDVVGTFGSNINEILYGCIEKIAGRQLESVGTQTKKQQLERLLQLSASNTKDHHTFVRVALDEAQLDIGRTRDEIVRIGGALNSLKAKLMRALHIFDEFYEGRCDIQSSSTNRDE